MTDPGWRRAVPVWLSLGTAFAGLPILGRLITGKRRLFSRGVDVALLSLAVLLVALPLLHRVLVRHRGGRPSDDALAVHAARGRLVDQGVAEEVPWRSTVVQGEAGGWVVRTWTRTPPEHARPSGTPDYVHRVSSSMVVEQVHPS